MAGFQDDALDKPKVSFSYQVHLIKNKTKQKKTNHKTKALNCLDEF